MVYSIIATKRLIYYIMLFLSRIMYILIFNYCDIWFRQIVVGIINYVKNENDTWPKI